MVCSGFKTTTGGRASGMIGSCSWWEEMGATDMLNDSANGDQV
jgi:hypothetical protein